MTARVLVVDDILANVKLLEARLNAEYFEVLTARSGEETLALVRSSPVDVVLLDVMMPGMNGFEVCQQIKSAPATAQLPIIMVTALDQASDKVRGLEAGADDFLTKPVDDIALITRVKNLARLKALSDEMMLRMATSADFKHLQSGEIAGLTATVAGRVLLVEDQPRVAQRMLSWLGPRHAIDVETELQTAMLRLAEETYDLLLVSLSLAQADGLRLCSQVRSLERTRHLPIIVLVEASEEARLLRALDMGVNDYVTRPIDKCELAARVRTQIKRKRHCDYLRDRLEESVELAVTDALTGSTTAAIWKRTSRCWGRRRSARASRCRCCWSTSTTSRPSMIPGGTRRGTPFCASWRRAFAATPAPSIPPVAWAGRSS